MTLNEAIQIMTREITAVLGENAPSVYLYGSVALGDFKLGWSDIDILVLTKRKLCAQPAETLVGLRQMLLERYPDNPYFRLFEGGMRSVRAFLTNRPERTVYWGTSGQRVTDNHYFDSFSMVELLDDGVLLHGVDVRDKFTYPTYSELRDDVRKHYDAIRKYAQTTDRDLYAFGWLLDIARCVYTLRTGKIIAKTAAGEWALTNGICPVPDALEKAVEVRRDPLAAKSDDGVMSYAETLGADIQKFADVLERELYIADPCGSLSTAFWKKRRFPIPDGIRIVREKELTGVADDKSVRYFKLAHSLKNIGNSVLAEGYAYRNAELPTDAPLVADFINRCYGYEFMAEEVMKWAQYPVHDADLWVFIYDEASNKPVALGIADFDDTIGEGALEWIQVLPEMRGRGFGTLIVNELLRRLNGKATFVTVSGECDNPTNPEKLYRKCGFEGDEVWRVIKN